MTFDQWYYLGSALTIAALVLRLAWHRERNDALAAELDASRRFNRALAERCEAQACLLSRKAEGRAS